MLIQWYHNVPMDILYSQTVSHQILVMIDMGWNGVLYSIRLPWGEGERASFPVMLHKFWCNEMFMIRVFSIQ